MAGVRGKNPKKRKKGGYLRGFTANQALLIKYPMAGKLPDRGNGKGTAEWSMRNWEDGQTSGAHPSRIIQPAEPVNQNHGEQGFLPFPNAFLPPAFNACLDAHAGVDPALLRYSRLPVQLPDHNAVAAPDPIRPTRTLVGHRPSPIITPATHELSAHLPLHHRRFPATSPISTGSNHCCRALPMPVKRTINATRQDDDVVVMEGVVVTSSASTGTWPRSSPAGAAGSSLLPTLLWSTSVLHKTEMCRSWEETGACGYGARCKVSRPSVSSTPREVAQNEEEKKIMPQTAEFEAMVDALINSKPDVDRNKRRLPIFVSLTDPTQREYWLKVGSEPSPEH